MNPTIGDDTKGRKLAPVDIRVICSCKIVFISIPIILDYQAACIEANPASVDQGRFKYSAYL